MKLLPHISLRITIILNVKFLARKFKIVGVYSNSLNGLLICIIINLWALLTSPY
jgi:hypothetical protein